MDKNLLNKIAKIFIKDELEYYSYKSGPDLVEFFNTHFGYNDVYNRWPGEPEKTGFPTRYIYVSDKLEELAFENKLNQFFNIILNIDFIIEDDDLSEVQAINVSKKILSEFNRILRKYKYILIEYQGKYSLEMLDSNREKIGEGGFAEV